MTTLCIDKTPVATWLQDDKSEGIRLRHFKVHSIHLLSNVNDTFILPYSQNQVALFK